ncbi:hypothetical protein D6C98_10093 [Aureobasidium pullulans]|nr:hypothetical protein D6C98_10093 [Aureobasidium pullulans]
MLRKISTVFRYKDHLLWISKDFLLIKLTSSRKSEQTSKRIQPGLLSCRLKMARQVLVWLLQRHTLDNAMLSEQPLLTKHCSLKRAIFGDDEAIDFSNWFTYLAFDIISEVVFSEPFSCLDKGKAT